VLKGFEAAADSRDLSSRIASYAKGCRSLQEAERSVVDLVRLALYEQGRRVLEESIQRGGDANVCPLCGKRFDGNLLQHIAAELESLEELRNLREGLEKERKQIESDLEAITSDIDHVNDLSGEFQDVLASAGQARDDMAAQVLALLKQLPALVGYHPEDIGAEQLDTLENVGSQCQVLLVRFAEYREESIAKLKNRQADLEDDDSRAKLVADLRILTDVLQLWDVLNVRQREYRRLARVQVSFSDLVSDYVSRCVADVQSRFDLISANVERYFGVLEQGTDCLSKPVIRLMKDQDRAVELEVMFYGEPICPAYKFLSESQLNSFGLAIFMASVRQFNPDFPFIILDDVINSFDGYKRPRVIDLLRNEFPDHQVLLLTHDSAWYDTICDKCPTWLRDRWVRLERGSGPIRGKSNAGGYDRIKELVDEDRAKEAGGSMGPYLEQQMAELCENFQVMVKYNRRNEYTLDPMVTFFCARVRKKLGAEHELVKRTEALKQSTGFRNLCAHWKNPAIPFTSPEMRDVFGKWEALRELVLCRDCGRYLRYDGKWFSCDKCGRPLAEA